MALGIYLHIPFCKAKCLYCDFNSYAGMEDMQNRYVNALCQEIQNAPDGDVDTIYFGGGTPTILPSHSLVQILSAIGEKYDLTPDCEISIECNPATIDKRGLSALRQAGFNRLSIGLQSANAQELKALGRIHDFQDFAKCFSDARDAGFQNISLDLMYGLPGQTMESWQNTLKKAAAFQPEHISCYSLKLEEGTPLFMQNPTLPNDDCVREFYDYAFSYLAEKGYHRYEISNFSLTERESRHNCKYWKCDDFLGFGAGAYSCFDGVRYDNLRNVLDYCAALETGKSPIAARIPLTHEDQMSEFCFLGLRMSQGIDTKEFQTRFGENIEDVFGDAIKKNLRRGTLLRLGDRLCIPPEYLFVSNSILVDFI
ncbi:MAG: oxygen-independent coproporphyrinogen III oxidase [Clostridia bacterium]|nr:oxygen-independent coproporphyrinogen III oxidase [Clostridia bacterium]